MQSRLEKVTPKTFLEMYIFAALTYRVTRSAVVDRSKASIAEPLKVITSEL